MVTVVDAANLLKDYASTDFLSQRGEALDGDKRAALEADLRALLDTFNTARDGTFVAPGGYLEVVVTREA